MSRKLNGQIGLHKLTHVIQKSKKGVDCIVIPLALNHIEVVEKDGKKYYNIPIVVWTNQEANEHGQHGSIKQSLSSEKYKSMEKEKAIELSKELPYLANLKDFSGGGEETTNDAGDGQEFNEGDDLPF